MNYRKLAPATFVLAFAQLGGGGCHRQNALAATPLPAATPPPAGAVTVQATPAPFATPPVLPGTPDVATLVAKVKPAVVNITTTHEIKAAARNFDFPFGLDPFGGAGPFQGRRRPEGDQVFKQKALGSGFIVDPRGYVVTNAHVVEGADEVRVKLADDREFDAKVRGRDARLDLALLEMVGAKDLPAVSLGSSEELRVGEYVVAIGNPFGLGHTVTMGIVSAKDRAIGAGPYDDFIQTDASINPGNSGGPLFDLRGQVIGINTAINPQGKGIGFAIPIDSLKDVLGQLVSAGRVARGRLGVMVQPVDPALAKALGMERPLGALVAELEAGGPAEKAGLRAGDVVMSVDGASVTRSEDLPRLVARHAPGTRVQVQVLRDRATRTIDLSLGELKDDESGERSSSSGPGAKSQSGLGIGVADTRGGVVVESVVSGGPADGQLESGDVIVEVNGAPIARAADLQARVRGLEAGKPVLLKVKREGKSRFVAIEKR
jgi:serine protease Do